MALTKEEKAALELQCSEAKARMGEVWSTVLKLRHLLKEYEEIHRKWNSRFQQADRKLAEEERLTVIPRGASGKREKKKLVFTQEEVAQLAKQYGVELEIRQ